MKSAWLVVAVGFVAVGAARAQTVNPVYVDDSPVARDTLARVEEFEAAGNEGEAVRELQRLLDDQPDRLVSQPGQNNLFVSVRARVHRKLLGSPKLLERYRAAETARAQKELDAGLPEAVERSRLLTRPGFEAALRVAQSQLESAEFEGARATLEQLRTHPDRSSPGAATVNADAARMLAQVARYIDRADVWDLAERWGVEAGLAKPGREAIAAPASLRQQRADFTAPAPPLEHDDVPLRPLWTSTIDPPDVTRHAAIPESGPEENAQNLYVLPSVVGDCVYVNDSTYITARDRFTLQPRWTLRPGGASEEDDESMRRMQPGRAGMRAEDTCTVTVRGRILVATTGLVQAGSRAEGGRTYALDAASGNVLWSFILPDLDPVLEGAVVRGPALIDGSTIVLVARKGAQQRRMVGLYLVGVHLDDGSLKWIRPIGSAGSIQFRGSDSRLEHAAVLYRGVVYCVDRLGIMAGVEAATGRPLWVRRWPVVAPGIMGFGMVVDVGRAWQWESPVVRDEMMVTLSPDRSELAVLERLSGEVRSRRPSVELGSPAYLLDAGSKLAAVAGDAVNFVPFDNPSAGAVTTTRTFAAPGIRGRVVVSGDRLLVPRSDGLAVINPANPARDEAVMRLDRIGNVLPLQNQLLVVDHANLYSFVTCSVAQRILEDRMGANPADPDPAITFAELAYRSQHPDQIVPAIDKAIAALDRNPTSELARQARGRLFEVIREMVDTSQTGWRPPEPPRPAPVQPPNTLRRPAPAPAPPTVEMPVLDPARLGPIVERWGRIAETADERAVQLLALGRQREAQGQPALAAESYQRILSDRLLAAASWRRSGVAVRAELEASRRTRDLVLEHGASIYAAFEAQAAQELASLGPGATAEDYERLARQYPAAAVAATVWMRCAELHENAGRSHSTVFALREGLVAAEAVRAAGVTIDDAVIGELGGRLVRRLQALDQVFAAAQLVSRLRAEHPGIVLLERGASIDAASLSAGLLQRLSALKRLPRMGSDILPTTQPLAGWVIMQPRSKEQTGRACEHVMLVAPGESRVALWGIPGAGGGDVSRHAAPLQELWTRPYSGSPPLLYRIDPDSVWLLWDLAPSGAVMERISTLDGQTLWKTEAFRTLFEADDNLEQRIQVARNLMETPMDGAVKLTDIAITVDEQVLAMVERSGRTACFDPASGKLLWKGLAPVEQVHDADAGGGAIVIGGQASRLGNAGMDNLVVVLDARSGRLVHRLDQLAGKVRWVRIAGGRFPADATRPTFVAGLDTEVTCFDLENGKVNWTIPGGPAFESGEAWIFGDRLFILDENRSLWLASVSTGKLLERQLETFEHLVGSGPIQGFAFGADFEQTAFTTDRGVCIFDPQGRLVGIDALGGGEIEEGGLLPPAASAAGFVVVETTATEGPGGKSMYNLHTLDARSAMLRGTRKIALELPPRRLALLDGKILITAGTNTVVYSVPEADR